MRYDNWDVLLFPTGEDSKTPFKEFRVVCNVIPDVELSHGHGLVVMPIMTCFVPSLEAGARFQLSVHSWMGPEISSLAKRYGGHLDLVQFEARIFIDGCLVASTRFGQKEVWPNLIDCKTGVTKSGELAPLKFPRFKHEALKTADWHPGDDIGRIKVVISEVIAPGSVTAPNERITNIVAFSFQPAPLEELERLGIAWPNRFMWSRSSALHSQLPVPPYCPDAAAQSHAHSPRPRPFLRRPNPQISPWDDMMMGAMQGQRNALIGNPWFPTDLSTVTQYPTVGFAPTTLEDIPCFDWCNPWAGASAGSLMGNHTRDRGGMPAWPAMRDPNRMSMSEDTAASSHMVPEFVSDLDKHVTIEGAGPMHISGPSLDDEPLPAPNVDMKVTTNSPVTSGSAGGSFFCPYQTTAPTSNFTFSAEEVPSSLPGGATINSVMTPNLTQPLTHSQLSLPLSVSVSWQPENTPLPASQVKSRKGSRLRIRHAVSNLGSAWSTQAPGHMDTRKHSQPILNASPSTIFNDITQEASSDSSNSSPSIGTIFSSGPGSHPVFGAGTLPETGCTSLPLGTVSIGGSCSAGPCGHSGRKRNRDSTPAYLKADGANNRSPLRPSPHMRISADARDESE